MAKPKITKLGDPANPYTKKKVSAAQAKASARAVGAKAVPLDTGSRPKPRTPIRTPGILGQAWKEGMDKKIKDAGG